jgi:ATP-binding cassette subfamily C (CFTR/MRP) protein 4
VRFITMGLIMFPYTAMLILQPLMLQQLVMFVGDATQPVYWGFVWASVMVAAVIVQFNCHHWYFWCSMRLGALLRSALGALIYTKALSLPTASLASTTTGQIVNLVSNDAEKFDELAKFLHYVWQGPLISVIAFLLIYQQVGISALAGFAVLILSIPVQTLMSNRFSEIRKNTIGFTDSRVKTINEILIGATVMKLYAWEEALQKSVARMREFEFSSIIAAAALKSINLTISMISGPLVYIATFVTYLVLTGTDGTDGLTPVRWSSTMFC